ncbi:hypothetical protein C8T65DRAFT_206141 [Cerioporus squamosus]|nr:hypothetical protein C8T65DRAFT_206141 [Cerioporus squamosus]
MANIARTSKAGNDWTPSELLAYNIRVVHQDSVSFFGLSELPQPQVADEILVTQDAASAQHDDSYTLLRTMKLAMATAPGQESAVTDFVVALFRVIRYTGRHAGRIARTRKDLRFWVCGKERHAKTDVCVLDEAPDIRLVVREDKRHLLDRSDPEPQLIAQAIAAFHRNYMTRVRGYGLPGPASAVMPGITMRGRCPPSTRYRSLPTLCGRFSWASIRDRRRSCTPTFLRCRDLPAGMMRACSRWITAALFCRVSRPSSSSCDYLCCLCEVK